MSRNASAARTLLLNILSDGQFHSGQDLGAKLGISRAAISKHIKALAELNLDIYSVTGKGYKLAKPLALLSQTDIASAIPSDLSAQIEVLNIIDSTNQYVKQRLSELSSGYTCLAEAQTHGRGRHGRRWVSPYGASLYMSTYWQFAGGYQAINGLSLVMGIAIAKALQSLAIEGVQLKWPNDVYLHGKKLAGVLIEVEGHLGVECDCIIGIGLNIDLPDLDLNIDQPWTDLHKGSGKLIERNQLASTLLTHIYKTLSQFESQGLAPYLQDWQQFDLFHNQQINVFSGQIRRHGVCKGINHQGALLLETEQGTEVIHGGEVSIRGQ